LEFSGREYMVRGRGYLTSVADIEGVSLGASPGGTPVRVRDVAHVRIGPDIRRGVAELDGKGEAVGGIIVMRFGENALRVIEGVKAKLQEVQRSMPPGIKIVPTYDRSWPDRRIDQHVAAHAHRGIDRRVDRHHHLPVPP
jgi:Cu(I)/Ag(I) efflux system membrane protein CusA/SilA